MREKISQIQDMISVFAPFPLKEDEQFQEFYVDTYEARGANAVKKMSYGLQYGKNPYMKILFMGHRGSGKSTELFLLKQDIQEQFEVISFFIQDEVDTVTMTYIDFVFAIMSQIVKFIECHQDLKFVESDIDALYKYWNEEEIIEKTDLEAGELKTGFLAKLSFLKRISVEGGGTLKVGSESKITIREKIEPRVGELIQLVNQIIGKINNYLGDKELIFIVEDLDKLSMEITNDLFVKNRKALFSIQARMILTFPIFMAYDVNYNMIKEDVDLCEMLSIIKVNDQNKEPFGIGIDKLKEIVYKRAEVSLFDERALDFMIMKSGGALRDLFQMIRDAAFEALIEGHTIIEEKDAKNAYKKLKSEYERLIRKEEDVKMLARIYNDPKPLTTDETVMSLLLRGLVLEYNGERWCGIHPAVEDFLREKNELGE